MFTRNGEHRVWDAEIRTTKKVIKQLNEKG